MKKNLNISNEELMKLDYKHTHILKKFINECQKSENKDGYLTSSFFSLIKNKNYIFKSGPFSEKIFSVINLQKNKIDLLLGNLKTRINKKKLLFSPL